VHTNTFLRFSFHIKNHSGVWHGAAAFNKASSFTKYNKDAVKEIQHCMSNIPGWEDHILCNEVAGNFAVHKMLIQNRLMEKNIEKIISICGIYSTTYTRNAR